jgi:hypothetical protein
MPVVLLFFGFFGNERGLALDSKHLALSGLKQCPTEPAVRGQMWVPSFFQGAFGGS